MRSPVKSPVNRSHRPTRKFGAQSTTLEALDDDLGPLGPLGDSFDAAAAPSNDEDPPIPPQKELAARAVRPESVVSGRSSLRGMMESVSLDDDDVAAAAAAARDGRARVPPPVHPPTGDVPRRSNQPSVSIEQAAKPSFDITVGDPHKVGDLTGSHTVYQVTTKVIPARPATSFSLCSGFPLLSPLQDQPPH